MKKRKLKKSKKSKKKLKKKSKKELKMYNKSAECVEDRINNQEKVNYVEDADKILA